jgi:receptor expression-enhancing protein 5/6
LEDKTGYPKAYFFGAIGLMLTFVLALLSGGKLFVNLAGFVYPAYMSFKSLEASSDNANVEWLTYWVVFSFFEIVESLAGFFVGMIPFYFWFKIAATVYLWHPQTKGAASFYAQVLRPLMLPYLEVDKPQKKD